MKIMIIGNISESTRLFRLELIKRLVAKHEVMVVAQFTPDDLDLFTSLDCQCIDVPIDRRGKNPFRDLALFFKYFRLIGSERPDIVLTYTIKPNIYAGFASRLHNVPYIATVEGLGTAFKASGSLFKFVVTQMYKVGVAKAHTVFYLNNDIKAVLHRDVSVSLDRLAFTPGMGANTDKYQRLDYPDSETPVFMTACRIMREKGLPDLIQASDKLVQAYPNLVWHICGKPERGEEYLLNEIKLRPWLKYHGMVKNLQPLMTQSWATVSPSLHEGLSTIAIESMASGRPMLASNVPGLMELVVEGETGFTFEAGNPSDIVTTLSKFIELSQAERASMGFKGYERAIREFDRERVNDIYETAIDKAIG